METLPQIEHFLDQLFAWGPWLVYTGVLVACFVENLFPPFPGDSFILVSGGLIAAGRLELWLTLLVVVVGGMTSVMLLYRFGRGAGRAYILKRNFKYFSAADVQVVEQRLARYGGLVLVLSRFVVGMRSVLAVTAGIGRYPAGKMLVYSTISYLIFTAIVMYAAMKLVENMEVILYYIRTYDRTVWTLAILLVAGLLAAKIISVRRSGVK